MDGNKYMNTIFEMGNTKIMQYQARALLGTGFGRRERNSFAFDGGEDGDDPQWNDHNVTEQFELLEKFGYITNDMTYKLE